MEALFRFISGAFIRGHLIKITHRVIKITHQVYTSCFFSHGIFFGGFGRCTICRRRGIQAFSHSATEELEYNKDENKKPKLRIKQKRYT